MEIKLNNNNSINNIVMSDGEIVSYSLSGISQEEIIGPFLDITSEGIVVYCWVKYTGVPFESDMLLII